MPVILTIVVLLVILIRLTTAFKSGKFSSGNQDRYSISNTPALANSPLRDKKIIFLGSSVTYGSASGGASFVDYMVKRDGIIAIKETVSGTTLIDEPVWGRESYITRMKTIDTRFKADAFVCQLSTNDATMNKPLGTVSETVELNQFDTHTVAGAIEYVIAYAQKVWNCPVIFYTSAKYPSEQYEQMIALLQEVQKKWGIGIIDLWNDPEMNAVSKGDYKLYMVNGIHPSKAGYREWWTPIFEARLAEYLV